MLRFMSQNIEEAIEELKAENLELKLGSIRKELATFKVDMHRHLDLILEQTSKTNGSVARAMEKIAEIERQDNKSKIEELAEKLEQHRKQTRPWTIISTNKWVRVGIIAVLVLIGLQFGTGITLFDLIKLAL